MASSKGKKSVLFICLGNICRSQIAEAVFRDLVTKQNVADQWYIDSSAMGPYHLGKRGPDSRAVKCLAKRGLDNNRHVVRQTKTADFTEFTFIFGMDEENMNDLESMKPKNSTAELKRLGDYHPDGPCTIVDPYYGEYEGFETVYDQCVVCCDKFLQSVSK